MHECFAVVALVASALAAQAQVVFTITATVGSTAEGYTSGNAYTFTLTTLAGFSDGADGGYWVDGVSPIFASVTGDLSGSYIRDPGHPAYLG